MKIDPQYDITPMVIDPEGEIEEYAPYNGMNEYGWACLAEVGKEIDPTLIRRMDNEVLRNLAAFAQKSPELDLSKVQLVESPKMPLDAKSNAWGSYKASKEEREAAFATATRFNYTRGWYVQAQEPTDG